MKRWVLLALFSVCASSWAADQVNSELREPAFADAQAALALANEQVAHLFAPENYSEGADAYRRAEDIFKDGGKLARLQKYLDEAVSRFQAAAEFAKTNRDALQRPHAARDDAENAGAQNHAPDLWRDGEVAFFEAATRLEAGRGKAAERYMARAEEKFREAELAAIETSLFAEVDAQIVEAREVDADDHAEVSYEKAVNLLAEARALLVQDRYDTDKPRSLANEALHNARHAEYVARLWDAIRDDDITFEGALGVWEREIQNIATLLDLPVYFDEGPVAASDAIGDKVTALLLRQGQLENELSDQERHASLLQEEVTRLEAELGGQSRARDRLQAELARQQRLKDRVRKVESMFRPEEAQVVRMEDRLVLRLLALNFRSGKADIVADHETVLAKLMEALSLFPETPIIVEGHTDAYGQDLTNLELSNRRAEAVMQFLLNNSPLSPALLTSVGYGESKPIANNETAEGRKKNRRIDVVLYPNW